MTTARGAPLLLLAGLAGVSAALVAPRPDPLRLEARGAALAAALEADRGAALAAPPESESILEVFSQSVKPPLPALWEASLEDEIRADEIRALSAGLDAFEASASGLYLAGPLSIADARLYPTVLLMHRVLPKYYGWEEWTDAALFWKRPNIHAWFELMGYEKAAEEAARELDASLSEVDWSALSLDVPVYRP